MSAHTGPARIPCPHCGTEARHDVTHSREAPWKRALQLIWLGRGIFRQRKCKACQKTFTTREYVWPHRPNSRPSSSGHHI